MIIQSSHCTGLTYCTVGDFNAVRMDGRLFPTEHHVEDGVEASLVVTRSEPVGPLHK